MNIEKIISCPTCKQALIERKSKTNKPYFVCDDCEVQIFIRGKRGIARLHGEMKTSDSPAEALVEELQLRIKTSKEQLRAVQGREGILSELWPSGEQLGIMKQIKIYKVELERIQK